MITTLTVAVAIVGAAVAFPEAALVASAEAASEPACCGC